MKSVTLIVISILITILNSCSNKKIIELPLSQQNGYGYFKFSMGGMSPYSNKKNNPWKKTYLSVTGAPKNWKDIKYGDIGTNIYQFVYQNYVNGNITKERYEELQKSWNWEPDTLELSKEPLKTKIAFAYGIDSLGVTNMILDANNNLDFSDDKSFIPFNYLNKNKDINMDSVALSNAINVTFERWVDNKKQLVTVPIFIQYMSKYNMFLYNFAQYSTANFDGKTIAVCSNGFTNLSYKKPSIIVINDTLKRGDKIPRNKLIEKNEFIEINGKFYKNRGVKINRNSLILEEMSLPKNKLQSTQIGFKSFSFEGNDFITGNKILSEQLKGKYFLLDFWAIWCGPCRMEIPNMKKLYKKTDRKKFEIVSIVGDSPSKALKEIIEKDSISWPQILSTDSNRVKETFGVQSYPTTFLVNPEGIIIAKNLRGTELENEVIDLLTEKEISAGKK